MKEFLKRKSVIALIIIALVGLFGPFFLNSTPSDSVGAPFARPVWLSSQMSRSVEYEIGKDGVSFEFNTCPPMIFGLSGEIFADKSSEVTIVWNTPSSSRVIRKLSGSEKYWIDIDARDMIFKQAMNFPLIGNAAEQLFPEKGTYSLTLSGANSSTLKLRLAGEKQGLLGTDQRGRDVFALFIYGIRTSLIIGIAATLIACFLGLGFGLTAGYVGGLTDAAIMRAVDVLLSIPTLPILMILAGVWGKGLLQIVLVLSIFSWMGTARSVRAMVLSLRESQWVEGLRALGAKRSYILWRHLIPETAPIMLANVAVGVPGAILSEAGLAFLGLSDPRMISWGRMLHEAHSFGAFTEGAWWLLLPPGIGIVAVCLIFMDIGRYLEEKVDPRLSGKKRNAEI